MSSKDGTSQPSPKTILPLPFRKRKIILANRNEAASSSFVLIVWCFGGASVQSGELTFLKPRKITRDNTEKRRSVNFIYLTVIKWIWGWNVTICGICETFLGITYVLRPLQITNNVRFSPAYQITDVTWPQTHRVVCLWLRRPRRTGSWCPWSSSDSRSTFGSSWRFKSLGPDLTNRLIRPIIIFTFYRGPKIRIIRPWNRTALTRTTIRRDYLAKYTPAWRTRSHDQIRSVYGEWLTKLHLGQFCERKKAQRGVRSTLCLFQYVTRDIQTLFWKSDFLAVCCPVQKCYLSYVVLNISLRHQGIKQKKSYLVRFVHFTHNW